MCFKTFQHTFLILDINSQHKCINIAVLHIFKFVQYSIGSNRIVVQFLGEIC